MSTREYSMRANSERSLPEVVQDMFGNVQEILRSEFQLAKTEVKEEAAEAATPILMMGVGVLLAIYGFGFLLLAAVYGLATIMAMWSAALLVGAVVAIIAVVLINVGRGKLKRVGMKPEKLIASLQEDVRWAKKQIE
jgi:uncharacterized membrane protein YqjE